MFSLPTFRLEKKPPSKCRKWVSEKLETQFGSSQFSHGQILSMLIPLILDQFFINLIGVLTTSMISSSSQESVAAVSVVSPIINLLLCIFTAVSAGGTVIVAQYKGHGDARKMRKAAGQVILAAFLLALTICIIFVIFAAPIVNAMFGAADEVIRSKARDYMIGSAISLVTFSVYESIFAVFRGVGATKTCLRLTVVINAIHLIASMLFINVLRMDIVGTALSLNVARLIGGAIALYLILKPNDFITLRWKDFLNWERKMFHSIVKMAVPFAVEQLFFNGGSILVQMYMVQLGTANVAANAVANSVLSLMFAPAAAVATLSITIVGQCVGAGDKKLAKWYGKKMNILGVCIIILSIAVLYPLSPVLLNFYHPEPETLGIISRLLLIGVIPMPFFWALSNIMPNVLRAAGDVNFPSIVSLITMWVIRVGAGYLVAVPLKFGIEGVWVCMGLEWAIRSLIFSLRYRGKKWLSRKSVTAS